MSFKILISEDARVQALAFGGIRLFEQYKKKVFENFVQSLQYLGIKIHSIFKY